MADRGGNLPLQNKNEQPHRGTSDASPSSAAAAKRQSGSHQRTWGTPAVGAPMPVGLAYHGLYSRQRRESARQQPAGRARLQKAPEESALTPRLGSPRLRRAGRAWEREAASRRESGRRAGAPAALPRGRAHARPRWERARRAGAGGAHARPRRPHRPGGSHTRLRGAPEPGRRHAGPRRAPGHRRRHSRPRRGRRGHLHSGGHGQVSCQMVSRCCPRGDSAAFLGRGVCAGPGCLLFRMGARIEGEIVGNNG